jgi:NAD(P)-dependent dehydrogenase (short-subunit alcohol dehydrogenase family)
MGELDGRLDGKVFFVTGGASGIGAATARRFAAQGARVCISDVDRTHGPALADELGGMFVAADVRRSDEVEAAIAQCDEQLGGLDVVHLNAGITTPMAKLGAIEDLTDDDYRLILGVNIDGVVFGTRAAARRLRPGGQIVATASLAGLVASDTDPLYTLTKHAVVGFVRSVATQLERKGIRINAVCPGYVDTPLLGDAKAFFTEAGFPLLTAEEVADAVLTVAGGDGTGEAWICQPGRAPTPFQFRRVPGPRVGGETGVRPPDGFDARP